MTALNPSVDHLRKMATPSRVGKYVGKRFLGRTYHAYKWILEVEKIVLEAIYDPEIRIIVVNVPPQNGKTTTFGMLLIAWYLGMFPFNQVIFIAYNDEYAGTWGEKTRNLMQQFGEELFGVNVSAKNDSKTNWKMSNGFGGMLSVGILGGITGNPGDLIVIDDVIKTMEDAASLGALQKHMNEWDGAISSRFQEAKYDDEGNLEKPGTTVVITATRFAEGDLSGSLVERSAQEGYEGRPIQVISIPALAEPTDAELEQMDEAELVEWRDFLGRRMGEGLEGQFSQKHYELTRATTDKFVWNAVFQQNPAARTGGMFPTENWMWWKQGELPRLTRQVRVWDLATTEGGGDWTVGTKMASAANGDIYVLDRQRFRKGTGEVELTVKSTAAADGYDVKIIIEQEKAGAGKTVVENFQRLLRGYTVEPGKAEGSKEQRATAYSSMQQQGRVFLPDWWPERVKKEWTEEHRKMMGDGRRPRHDDQIDTGAYGVLDLLGQEAVDIFVPSPENWMSAQAEMRFLTGQAVFN